MSPCLELCFLIRMHESEGQGASPTCNLVCHLRRGGAPKDEMTVAKSTHEGRICAWKWFRLYLREPCAEFLGTLVVCMTPHMDGTVN